MARQLRIEYEGAIYHIMARGNEKGTIFSDTADYEKFIDILQEALLKYSLAFFAYVLMKNHYHLLLKTTMPNLSAVMHFIQTKYAIYFNKRYKRVGHLFQGRYKSIVVEEGRYLLEVSRYIHLNPVRAGIVARPEDYKWSSFREYINEDEALIERSFILKQFSFNEQEAKIKYKTFCDAAIDKGLEKKIKDSIYGRLILGSKDFGKKVKGKVNRRELTEEILLRRKLVKRISKEEIIEEVEKFYKKERSQLLKWKIRKKDLLVYLLRKYTDMKLKDVAVMLGGGHYSSITKIAKRVSERVEKGVNIKEIEKIIEGKKLG